MAATGNSKARVGQALAEYVARGLFDASHGADPALAEGNPVSLTQDVHVFSQLWFSQERHTNLDEAICNLPVEFFDFEYNVARWHANYIDVEAMARAHILRLAHGWKYETALWRYLKNNFTLITELGFDSLPDQSALYRAWRRFSDEHQQALEAAAREVVGMARYYDVPAPARAFQPEQDREKQTRDLSTRELTVKKTKEVWEQAKPHISEEFALERGKNWSIPEHGYWQQHAFAGLQSKYVETAAKSDDFRDKDTPSGSEHRRQIQKLTVEQTRAYFQEVTKRLVKEARRKNELDRGVTVAIDKTKGPVAFTGEIERDENGNIAEPWILGYKNKKLYFQWATVQIVGNDLPIILDAIPMRRGMKIEDIVDELLSTATDLVNVEEFQADREFDVYGVRDVVESHDIVYREAAKVTGHRGTCTALRKKGAVAHITEEGGLNGANTRKTVFVPARDTEIYDPDKQTSADVPDDDPTETDDEPKEQSFRQGLVEDFGDVVEQEDDDDERRMFGDFLDDVRDEEESRPESQIYGSDADVEAYAIFKTNDPKASIANCENERDVIETAERAVRPYRHRWGIEEGNKKLKEFMAKTKSRDHEFRYFNMAYGALLYNVWRLVDLLVQLSLEREYDYSPLITAAEFLTCAEEHFDLDTPPPPVVVGAV